MKIGQRVRVAIQKRQRYAVGAADALDCRAGVIEEAKESSMNSVSGCGPAFLVRFDEPAPSWWAHGMPHECFWFDPCDLVTL